MAKLGGPRTQLRAAFGMARDEKATTMNSDIEKAKAVWQLANEALLKARKDHFHSPTSTKWTTLVRAANRWQRASAAWSAAIVAAGDRNVERAAFVEATTIRRLRRRKHNPH